MARYTDGDLRKILSGLDIYQENLKTWTDLQEYVAEKSGGKITPEKLNDIAASILAETDPSITVLRDKILIYSDNSSNGTVIRQSVSAIDLNNIKLRGKWLQAFYNESLSNGLTNNQISDLLAILSALPDTEAEEYMSDLLANSEEPLISALKSLNLKKEKIKTPKALVLYLITDNDKVKYPEDAIMNSIANLIIAKNIPADIIKSQLTGDKGGKLWIIWILLGACLFFFFLFFLRRKKNKNN